MLEPVCDNLWHVTEPMRMPGGVTLPIRMTVVRSLGGDVLLHSPVPLAEDWAREVEALGPVRWVIAPNLYHHLYAKPSLERFSGARLFCAPGLGRKRRDLADGVELDTSVPEDLAKEFDMVLLGGAPKMNEVVLFHRPSASVIASDLVFNVKSPPNFMAGVLLSVFGTRGRFAKSRMWGMLVKDKPAFADSLERVCAWPAQRVIMGHGDILEQDAQARLQAALA